MGKKAFDNTLENNPVVLSRDQFAKNQLFMILSGYKESDIREYLKRNGSSIKNEFDENFDQKQSQYFLESKRGFQPIFPGFLPAQLARRRF